MYQMSDLQARLLSTKWEKSPYQQLEDRKSDEGLEINRVCEGGHASIGRVWFPDWDITVGRGMAMFASHKKHGMQYCLADSLVWNNEEIVVLAATQ
ncbi:uncharacterized protein EAF02_008455 [Botrytis sinoallii]|uniref:uncharacterized protein n=1 Tax=Botrytis sinoallii TaxID=1463999 RepID=UPI00190078AB|nr:uncharacterized protein EAF02_008455 [Botrytis sinoallii]KAF7874478.1 hypothetical protein EAF02_008455 [Botrytis sinoallii]